MASQVEQFKAIKRLVTNGYAAEFKFLSICYIPDYYNGWTDDKETFGSYQIDCDHHLNAVSELEKDVDKAIIRFLELKRKCYGKKS